MNSDSSSSASGQRAISATHLSGIAVTGDNAYIDARTITIAGRGIPRPSEVDTPPGMGYLPRPAAGVFLGRDAALHQLGNALSSTARAVVTQAVYGLGGVGKSELVLQYAHSHRSQYGLVWWIAADDSTRIEAGLATLAARLYPEIAVAATTADAAEWAVSWLQTHSGWLLILDNVDTLQDIAPLLGQLQGGHIVFTTRRDIRWDRYAEAIPLDILAPQPATEFITTTTRHGGPDDRTAADAIAGELGYLPLALDQAAAYIIQTRITPGQYLDRLRDHPMRMYAAYVEGGDAQRTIMRLWDITFAAINERTPDAIWLLGVLAHYAADNIPRDILGWPPSTEEDVRSIDVDDALGLLASYSMIKLTNEIVSIHRLVQAVTLAKHIGSEGELPDPKDTALEWLNAALLPRLNDRVDAWPLLRALAPHADRLASHYTPGSEPDSMGRVLNQFATFHISQGSYELAKTALIRSLKISERILGPNHSNIAAILNNLAVAHKELGHPADALSFAEQALAITKTNHGANHAETASCLGNLAAIYSGMEVHDKALELQEQALVITRSALGAHDLQLATYLGNLALTLDHLGRHAEALPLNKQALRITESGRGSKHPETAIRLGNLAITYGKLGQHTKALALEKRALEITEATLGPEHPETARRLSNLADTYSSLGRGSDALPLAERALVVSEATLGSNHPETARRLSNLADTYGSLGRYSDALPLAERAVAITEGTLGPEHPTMPVRLGTLAAIHVALGDYVNALRAAARAYRCATSALGASNPTTQQLAHLVAYLRRQITEG